MEDRKIRVAITHGDTNGVGYEVIFKAFAAPEMLELCTPIIYGSPKVAAYHRKMLNLDTTFSIINKAEDARQDRVNLLTTFDEEVKVEIGASSKEAGTAALKALERAMIDYKKGLFDVLVTAPINKYNIQNENFKFCGHTEYLEDRVGDGQKALMIMMNDYLRVGLVTTHLPIKDVAQAITKEKIIEKANIFHQALRRDLRISSPRIAVLSLNPPTGNETDSLCQERPITIDMPTKELVVKMPARSLNTYIFTIDPGAAAINEVAEKQEKKATVVAYYDLHGRRLDSPCGLCVERMSDGSSKVVYMKD